MGELRLPSHAEAKGRLFIVGSGPGGIEQMTGEAVWAIAASDCVIGNQSYLDALQPLLAGKEVIRSSMGQEVERAKRSIALARNRTVAMISGGDAGIYGMASIVLEVLDHAEVKVPFVVIPGVTAANAAAALLGSPLSGDFVTLSLSDLLTPLEVIERRLSLAFQMGVPVALYNPKSRGRPHNFAQAMEIAARYRAVETPIGIVQNAYRDGERVLVTTLGEVDTIEDQVDMHSIVIIGGEESRIFLRDDHGEGIITPRGYHRKYVY
ncbi:precorrin-3B C(17)-methyltransferase [Methanosphaerula subterraneus]|uniref:precorrin-3B C(17)-methyltransferase n=1 Tax=Methanosphaerula subterraneus TaxID=3350244 RepID=UPI003F875BCD